MKDTYIFPAFFESNEDGITIFFPDFPGSAAADCAQAVSWLEG